MGRVLIVALGLALAVTTMVAWATWAGRTGSTLGITALMAVAAAVGPTLGTETALAWADTTVGLLAAAGAVQVLVRIKFLRQKG